MSKNTEAKRRKTKKSERRVNQVHIVGKLTVVIEAVPNSEFPDQPDAKARIGVNGMLPNPEEILGAFISAMIRIPSVKARIEEMWDDPAKMIGGACLLLEAKGVLEDFEESVALAKVEMQEAAEANGMKVDEENFRLAAELETTADQLREIADAMDDTGSTVVIIGRDDLTDHYKIVRVFAEEDKD